MRRGSALPVALGRLRLRGGRRKKAHSQPFFGSRRDLFDAFALGSLEATHQID